jgi:ATP-binding cassette subfamily C (CFTR/MRP) protein 4
VDCLIRDNITLRIETLAIKMRTAFTSLIYRKVLRISSTQVETVSVGKIITLITRDVNEFEVSIPYIITLLNNLVYFIVVCYVLYKEIGWLVITLIGTFCIVISIQGN